MRRELRSRFGIPGMVAQFALCPPGNLDGVHGAMLMTSLFGMQADYYPDNWPAARHDYLTPRQTAALAPPVLEDTPAFVSLLEQMEVIEREFGRIEGYLNWQGVLNTAYRIRGPEILADMLCDPDSARHLFDVITETMIAGMRRVYARQAQSGVHVDHATVSNCLVNMVSPALYETFLLPCDRRIAQAFRRFGIHNCAWNVDPYVEHYARVTPLDYVDMGLSSNLETARKLCPGARRAVMYTPMDLLEKSPEAIQADLKRILRELGPCDVVMADIDAETPDTRVREFADWAQSAVESG